jgi:hypothetical protein
MNFNIDLTKDEIFEIINKALDEGILNEREVIFEVATRYGCCFDDHDAITSGCIKIIQEGVTSG